MSYAQELFAPLPKADEKADAIVRPSLTYWQDAWRRFRKNIPAMVSMAVVIILIVGCIVIPMFWPYSYDQQIRSARGQSPSWEHPMGTDSLGRDMFVRVLYGGRISLSIGIVASIINLVIGVLYGGIAGSASARVDNIMMRIVEILYAVPMMLYVILLQVGLQKQIEELVKPGRILYPLRSMGYQLIMVYIVLGIVYWVGMARMVRGQVLGIKNQEYVMAARSQGASTMRIIMKHLVPNTIGQIIVMVTMAIPTAIFTESFLSFIGLGVSAPMCSWGSLASDAYKGLVAYPYLLLFPAAAICITMLAFNILGDGLRDALDPKMRK